VPSLYIKIKVRIMAQSAVTVRIDSEIKSQFDELCEQFGMSANTAFNIFVKAVIRSRSIPFTIKGSRAETPSALDLFMQQRRAAEASQDPEMTLNEINAEIRAAREERRKKQQMV
jgi:DNA-damage-inducible protein J